MIFSLPSLFPWLAAAILPWVLHLFLFRKAETLYFPSLFFLKRCYGWSSRLKLRRLLLLLTRSALLLYFILGMLDPRVERAASDSRISRTAGPVLVVLDDRPAMRMKLLARSDSLFDVYRQAVMDDLERRFQTQDIAAVPLSELSLRSSIRMGSPRDAAGKIRGASVQTLTSPVEENLRFAIDRFHAQVLFYSPFQIDLRNPKLARVGPSIPCEPNFTLISLKSPARAFVGQPISVRAQVADIYSRPADAMVRLSVDGREAAVIAAVQGQAAFLLTGIPAGRHLLKAEVLTSGGDGYPEDDARTTQVTVTPDRSVGFAAKSLPRPLVSALSAFGLPASASQTTAPGDWETKQRMAVLDFEGVTPDVLQRALSRGMDLILFADAFSAKPAIHPLLSVLNLQSAPEVSLAAIDANALYTIWRPDDASRMTSEFESEKRYIHVVKKIKIVQQAKDEVLAAYADGSSAVLRRSAGRGAGTVTVVSFSLADPVFRSDPSFLLFVHGLLSSPGPEGGRGAVRSAADVSPQDFSDIPLQANAAIPLGPIAPPAAVRMVGAAASSALSLGYAQGQFFAELPTPAPPPGLYRMLIGNEEKATVHLYPTAPVPLALPGAAGGVRRIIDFEPFFFWMAVLLMAVELLLLRNMRPIRAGGVS